MFVDREEELAFLNQLLTRRRPGPGQLVIVYGRRRIGKTALLQHWAEESGLPYTYWIAGKEPPAAQRRRLFAQLVGMPEEQGSSFDSWSAFWNWFVSQVSEARHILVLDEFQYASEAEPTLLSSLQQNWDEHLKDSNLAIVLCGSQVKTMETVMKHQSPLFGRFTGQWLLGPLPFSALKEFFPRWSPAERVALYAIVGGVPAYLEWLDPDRSLSDNIRDVILSPGSMFMAEPSLLLYDELRDLSSYHAVLRAISNKNHTLSAISEAALVSRTNLTFFLSRLRELRFVERRLPVTLTAVQRRKSKQGRYHMSDPYFRFYYRFLVPHQKSLLSAQQTLQHIQQELRSFVGVSFEDLAQQWLACPTVADRLPFVPEAIGAFWNRQVQVDVVAINRRERCILLGDCKWGTHRVGRAVVRELVEEKAPQVLKALAEVGSEGWTTYYALFTRVGLTDSAQSMAHEVGALTVDLDQMDRDLCG